MTDQQAEGTIKANLTALPDKVGVEGLEDKWRATWDEDGMYKFRNTRARKAVYSIDTPPPTVSGHLHVGHVFSYTASESSPREAARLRRTTSSRASMSSASSGVRWS